MKASFSKPRKVYEMASEYRFDYGKAKPNRFASRMKDAPLVVVIDPDVAKIFTATEEGEASSKSKTCKGKIPKREETCCKRQKEEITSSIP